MKRPFPWNNLIIPKTFLNENIFDLSKIITHLNDHPNQNHLKF
jgi:hypothetical protein